MEWNKLWKAERNQKAAAETKIKVASGYSAQL